LSSLLSDENATGRLRLVLSPVSKEDLAGKLRSGKLENPIPCSSLTAENWSAPLSRFLSATNQRLTATATSASIAGEAVFTAGIVAGRTNMALPIPCLVAVEVIKPFFPAPRQRSTVTVTRVKAVVDMAVKTAVAVKPGTSANEYPAQEPVGPIVAVGGAVVWRIVEVTIGANRRNSDADTDGNLGWTHGTAEQKGNCQS
jgi:hypothetical protein